MLFGWNENGLEAHDHLPGQRCRRAVPSGGLPQMARCPILAYRIARRARIAPLQSRVAAPGETGSVSLPAVHALARIGPDAVRRHSVVGAMVHAADHLVAKRIELGRCARKL